MDFHTVIDPHVSTDIFDFGPLFGVDGEHDSNERGRLGWLLWLVVVPRGYLLHETLEVGSVERHGSIDEGVEEDAQRPNSLKGQH